MQVPVLNLKRHYLSIKGEIDAAVTAVLDSQRFIRGPQVAELEQAVATAQGSSHAVAVASGTDALLLSLEALGLGPGDEVVTTPFTFTATAEAILRAGATPVFADIDPGTFNLSPAAVEKAVTKKTRGLLPVHLFGLAADLGPLMETAARHRLWVLEDCAQAQGAAWGDKPVGGIGAAGAFSFFPSKNLGGFGDGGMVTTSDPSLAETVRVLSEHGGKDKYNVTMLGHNSRLDTIQAAVLLAKLKKLDEWNAARARIARRYRDELDGLEGLVLPVEPAGFRHAWNQFTVRSPRRDQLKDFLAGKGIGTAVYYPYPLHGQALFRERARAGGPLAEAERAAAEVLSLPVDPLMTGEEQGHVIKSIREFQGEN